MRLFTKLFCSLLVVSVCIVSVGCGKGTKDAGTGSNAGSSTEPTDIRKALSESYSIYHDHMDIYIHGPENMEKFLEYADKHKKGSKSIKFVTKEGFTFKWNVKIKDVINSGKTMTEFPLISHRDGRKVTLGGIYHKGK